MATAERVGVVIGRFHVDNPHFGHRELVRHVFGLNKEVVIVLGESAGLETDHNPLPFQVRRIMMEKEFPKATVVSLKDMRDDRVWSLMLDELIAATCPGKLVTLYGSRDSFIDSYTGIYETVLVPLKIRSSGTALREKISKSLSVAAAFRRGIIWYIMNRPPITYPTVDVAVIDYTKRQVLLGRKPHDPAGCYRFIGGFVDPTDSSYESAAGRERVEESGDFGIDKLEYVGSARIDDWRYRGTKDGIMTTFFRTGYHFGMPEPADDISELKWTPLEEMMDVLVPEHRPLGTMLLASLAHSAPATPQLENA